MSLIGLKTSIKSNAWGIAFAISVTILSSIIYYRYFHQPKQIQIYTIQTSPDLPTLTTDTKYQFKIQEMDIPSTLGVYDHQSSSQINYQSIANSLDFRETPFETETSNGKILSWRNDGKSLSVSTASKTFRYEKFMRDLQQQGTQPTKEAAASTVQELFKKIGLFSKNLSADNPNIVYLTRLEENAKPVSQNDSYNFIVLNYVATLENLPIIYSAESVQAASVIISRNNEIIQLRIDLGLLQEPSLIDKSKTINLKQALRDIKAGRGLLISSTGGQLLETDTEVRSFTSSKASLAFIKADTHFIPVVVLEGKAVVNTTRVEEDSKIIVPVVENAMIKGK